MFFFAVSSNESSKNGLKVPEVEDRAADLEEVQAPKKTNGHSDIVICKVLMTLFLVGTYLFVRCNNHKCV